MGEGGGGERNDEIFLLCPSSLVRRDYHGEKEEENPLQSKRREQKQTRNIEKLLQQLLHGSNKETENESQKQQTYSHAYSDRIKNIIIF